jgi:AraC family transcriptional regulator
MSTPRDTFVAFVDTLSAHLDDHEMNGEDLAAKVFMSRFHLDRVVSAIAGESPGRFRRRVLLERAAFRLATADVEVLDVAIEAGYSSNEAFTRAFQRAYGSSPSQWRREPTPVHLDSPSRVHFLPPGTLRVPARSEVTSMDLLAKMAEHHVWLVGDLLERAEPLDDSVLDELIRVSVDNEDGSMTMRSILSRLVGQMDMWMSTIEMKEYDFDVEKGRSVAAMRDRLSVIGPSFLQQVHEVIEGGRLDDTFIDAHCDPVQTFTYGGMIAHVLTFASYNRTLVVQALMERGMTDLNWGDPLRWVAEGATP